MELSGDLCRSVRCLELYGAAWSFLELSGTVWRFLELSETLWRYLELSGAVWNSLELSEAIWSFWCRHGILLAKYTLDGVRPRPPPAYAWILSPHSLQTLCWHP